MPASVGGAGATPRQGESNRKIETKPATSTHHAGQYRAAIAGADPAHARIADIAASWGFQDPSLFSRRFRAAFGLTPSAVLREERDMPESVRMDFKEAPLESKSYRNYLAWLQQAADAFSTPSTAQVIR